MYLIRAITLKKHIAMRMTIKNWLDPLPEFLVFFYLSVDLTDCSFPIPGTLQSALYHNETVHLIGTEDWQAVLRLTKDQG